MNQQDNGRDPAWLQRVVAQYEAPLVGYASRLVGDTERGRDIVQDVFLRLCREHDDRMRDHLAAWLYTVCRNRALDTLKKERRMTSVSLEGAAAIAAGTSDPAAAVERQENAGQACVLLNRLPENQQEVIRLKIEHGLKYREISDITGLSVSNVGYLLHQGLKTLRQQLST